MKDVIIIDGSYYCFYRYYAILNWFKCTKKVIYQSMENTEFVEKFKTTFIKNTRNA